MSGEERPGSIDAAFTRSLKIPYLAASNQARYGQNK